jgi:hypothetical protein
VGDAVAEGRGKGVHVGGIVALGEFVGRDAVADAGAAVGFGVEDGAAARSAAAVGLGQGMMGFSCKCLMPITSRTAPQSRRTISMMRRYRRVRGL